MLPPAPTFSYLSGNPFVVAENPAATGSQLPQGANALSPALAVPLVNGSSVNAASIVPRENCPREVSWSTAGSPPHPVITDPEARACPNCGPAGVK